METWTFPTIDTSKNITLFIQQKEILDKQEREKEQHFKRMNAWRAFRNSSRYYDSFAHLQPMYICDVDGGYSELITKMQIEIAKLKENKTL